MIPDLAHEAFARCLERLQMGVGASELHGSLSGFLCAGGLASPESWLRDIALDELAEAVADSSDRGLFARFYAELHRALDDPELAFNPLLPPDDAPLDTRSVALVEWCRGFLGGVGLSGAELKSGVASEVGEMLSDFERIASTSFDPTDSIDDDEDSYAEVVEYVRIGALLLRTELVRSPAAATRH